MTNIRSCGSKSDALNTVERIRDLREAQLWISAKLQRKVTVSIGLTQYIPGESILDLFSRADAAMYWPRPAGATRWWWKSRSKLRNERPAGDQRTELCYFNNRAGSGADSGRLPDVGGQCTAVTR